MLWLSGIIYWPNFVSLSRSYWLLIGCYLEVDDEKLIGWPLDFTEISGNSGLGSPKFEPIMVSAAHLCQRINLWWKKTPVAELHSTSLLSCLFVT